MKTCWSLLPETADILLLPKFDVIDVLDKIEKGLESRQLKINEHYKNSIIFQEKEKTPYAFLKLVLTKPQDTSLGLVVMELAQAGGSLYAIDLWLMDNEHLVERLLSLCPISKSHSQYDRLNSLLDRVNNHRNKLFNETAKDWLGDIT